MIGRHSCTTPESPCRRTGATKRLFRQTGGLGFVVEKNDLIRSTHR